MSCNTSTFQLGIRNILIGEDTKQKTCISTKKDVAGSLGGKFFVLHQPNAAQTKHVFWFNTGTSVAPVVPNATLHEVDIVSGDSAIAVATALQTVLAALTWIESAVRTNEHIEVTFADEGYAYEGRDAIAELSKTKFQIVVTKFGSLQADAGGTNGDITVTIEESLQDVTTPQTGDYVLTQLRRGVTATLAFELKSTADADIRRALNYYGGTYVTDDADSAVLTGYGSKNLFKTVDDVATKIIFREPALAADGDSSKDLTFHKCKLALGELTLSAESELVLPLTATVYLDQSKFNGLNFLSFGDSAKVPSV